MKANIFLNSLFPEPRIAEPLEAVPAHSLFVESELGEQWIEPVVGEIPVEIRSAVACVQNEF